MGAFETKAMILAEVLRQEGIFKAQKVHNNLGLDRRTVDYHLRKLVESGALEKNGLYYSIADKDILINQVADLHEGPRIAKPKSTVLFPWESEEVSATLDILVALRAIHHPVATDVKVRWLENIDDAVREFKNARKFIASASRTEEKARKILKDKQRVWTLIKPWAAEFTNEQEFMEGFEDD